MDVHRMAKLMYLLCAGYRFEVGSPTTWRIGRGSDALYCTLPELEWYAKYGYVGLPEVQRTVALARSGSAPKQ